MSEVVLPGGERLEVRPIGPDDKALLHRLHESLSPESQHRRFLCALPHLSGKLQAALTELDHHEHEGLFALEDGSGAPVGTARFIRLAPGSDEAEFAVTVTDAWQGTIELAL